MIFTREPIIETIITPREGYKLSVKSSKGETKEEYQVDALEIVSFGSALFFRSQERPKCFLLPVSDYEVLETRETRIVLKTATPEKAIKIGGGRESGKPREAQPEKREEEEKQEISSAEQSLERFERKRDRRRHRRRRAMEERGGQEWQKKEQAPAEEKEIVEEKETIESLETGDNSEETQIPPAFTHLIPPPTVLISETLSRYKDAAFFEEKKGNGETEEEKKKRKKSVKEETSEELSPETPDSSGAEIELHEETLFYSPDPDSPYIP